MHKYITTKLINYKKSMDLEDDSRPAAKKFPAFYATRWFITMLKASHCWILFLSNFKILIDNIAWWIWLWVLTSKEIRVCI
jgi:hypothetical protein